MKKLLIISFSDLSTDPRPYRQIIGLKDHYEITTVAYKESSIKNIRFYPVKYHDYYFTKPYFSKDHLLLKSSKFKDVYWKKDLLELKETLLKEKFDYIIANDINSLPLAIESSGDAKVIFDAHEYSPEEFNDLFIWRFFAKDYINYLCKTYIPKTNKMLTVCDGLAQEYFNKYNVKPEVITNACEYHNLEPQIPRKTIKIIYHGIALPSRKTEKMIQLANYLDNRFTIDFLLMGDIDYISKLKKIADKNPRIKIKIPVPRHKLVTETNKYDIGLFLLEPTNLSYQYALPNKLFEYLQARLMIAIGPSIEMKKIVDKYNCGLVAEDFDPKSLAKKLNNLTKDDILHYKQQSNIAAQELNAENNYKKWQKILGELNIN